MQKKGVINWLIEDFQRDKLAKRYIANHSFAKGLVFLLILGQLQLFFTLKVIKQYALWLVVIIFTHPMETGYFRTVVRTQGKNITLLWMARIIMVVFFCKCRQSASLTLFSYWFDIVRSNRYR